MKKVIPIALVACTLASTSVFGGSRSHSGSSNISFGFGISKDFGHVRIGGDRYYHRGGHYYERRYGRLHRTHTPRGAHIRHLPRGCVRVVVGGQRYYRDRNVYYQSIDSGYQVVPQPVVIERPTVVEVVAPKKRDVFNLDGKNYVLRDGQFFSETPQGLVWEEVPAGAISERLPADAESIWFNQIEYFAIRNVYFRKTHQGYKVVTEPWLSQAG